MTHGSLFSGIGGFDLAAEWMGWDNVFHCEWNDFGKRILHHYWPEAISYGDITKTDFTIHRGSIDILTGGFPCQPYSAAGKRLGKEDDRHLWPEMLRAIREIGPRYVVGENVRGLTNWNGGLVFDEVQADLESAGYEVLPFILPACGVDAPHRRDRVWFVAHAIDSGNNREPRRLRCAADQTQCLGSERETAARKQIQLSDLTDNLRQHAPYADYKERIGRCDSAQRERSLDGQERQQVVGAAARYGQERAVTNTASFGPRQFSSTNCGRQDGRFDDAGATRDASDSGCAELQRGIKYRGIGAERAIEADGRHISGSVCTTWQDFPTQSPICGRDDGLPAQLDGITFPKWRAESIKGYGNAIVPQVALQIFRAIHQYELDL